MVEVESDEDDDVTRSGDQGRNEDDPSGRGRAYEADLLPALIDRRRLAEELGVGHGTVDAILRHVPVIAIPGHRKVFVRRDEVERMLREHTYRDGEQVRPA